MVRFTRQNGVSFLLAAACAVSLGGCAQGQWQPAQSLQGQTLRGADETMDAELADRVARVQRLARLDGIAAPAIEQLSVPAQGVPGAQRAIPVIRVTFAESGFFAPGSAVPQQGAISAMRVMAEDMRRDVPDLRVTVLGHTDATGSQRANQALGRARALAVMQALADSGANPGQLSVVAIGDAQPVASNGSEAGRARNRRVEFLLSPSEAANMALVARRHVDPALVASGWGRRRVAVLRPGYARPAGGGGFSGPADFSEAPGVGAAGGGGRVFRAGGFLRGAGGGAWGAAGTRGVGAGDRRGGGCDRQPGRRRGRGQRRRGKRQPSRSGQGALCTAVEGRKRVLS